MSNVKCVKIIAPAHLHAGNIDLSGDFGRLYGTIGFTIDYPQLVVKIEKGENIEANDVYALKFAKIISSSLNIKGFKIVVEKRFIEYAGLGYITSLGLAIGVGVSRFFDLGLDIEDVALIIKRGLVTALGVYACKYGGFIVEGGFRKEFVEKSVPPLIFRSEIPENWVFVVVVPRVPWQKIVRMRIEKEDKILKEISIPSEESSYLSRLVLMKIIPAFIEKDLKVFGEALTEFNKRLGYYWEKYQGGIYCDKIVEKGIEIMIKYAYSACQSSWGPTFYGILDNSKKAQELVEIFRKFLDENGGGDVFIAKGRNKGLEVEEYG